MGGWPKTPVELKRCIGAEGVRSIRWGGELCCLVCSAGTFIECDKFDKTIKIDKVTKDE